jgi:hypothetical protein
MLMTNVLGALVLAWKSAITVLSAVRHRRLIVSW